MPFRLTSTPPPTWYGHKCVVCHVGTESRDLWFDGDIEVEFEGTYLICAECIREAAGALNMVTDDAADELLTRALAAEGELEVVEERLALVESALSSLRRLDEPDGSRAGETEAAVSSPTAASARQSSPASTRKVRV